MQNSFYPEKVMQYLLNPINSGTLQVDNKRVFLGEYGSPDEGMQVKLFISFAEDLKVNRVKYLVYGDGYIIASLSELSLTILGMTCQQLKNYSLGKLSTSLDLPAELLPKLKFIKKCITAIITQYERCYNTNRKCGTAH